MKKKIICMYVCLLLITTAIPAVASLKNSMINSRIPNTPLTSMTAWIEKQKLLASNGATKEYIGRSISIDGDTALTGAYLNDGEAAAYVFTRTGNTWTQQQKLLALDGAAGGFGHSVSLDGDTALIGAPQYNDGISSGSAYVFIRTGTTWTQQAKLLTADRAAWDWFGCSVSLDGDTALIGAYGDNDNGDWSGSSYVFTRTCTTWTQQAKLLAADGVAHDLFGWSVSLYGDTALIGAPDDNNMADFGSAYVFTRTGTTWTQQQKLLPLDSKAADMFGVAVSLDGDTALIGADEAAYAPTGPGKVYVFTRTSTTWTQQAKLRASEIEPWQLFGWSVSLSGDTILIGVPLDSTGNIRYHGSAYVFTRTGTTWTQQQKLLASDRAARYLFGGSVSLDGDTAIITAFHVDDMGNRYGSAYVFTRTGTTWTEQTKLPTTNDPPNKPSKPSGQIKGKPGVEYSYTTSTTDPNGDEVYYLWDWGDGNNSGWLGPYNSSGTAGVTHNWTVKGSYSIKVKAKDIHGNESNWSDPLPITMPFSYHMTLLQLLQRFFQRFPNAFPLLRQMMEY